MKEIFYGILIGVVVAGLVGLMLFDNFKTKLVVNNLASQVTQIVQFLNQKTQGPAQVQPVK